MLRMAEPRRYDMKATFLYPRWAEKELLSQYWEPPNSSGMICCNARSTTGGASG